jgi:hypothetical protein
LRKRTYLLDNPHTTRSALSIFKKKALLRLVSKKIVVKEGVVAEVDLYEPFKSFVLEKDLECLTKEIKPSIGQNSQDCTSVPSDGRCPPYRRTMASLAEALVEGD